MRASELPRLGVIENYTDGEFFGQWSDLRSRDILCLGFSEAQIDQFIAPHLPNSVHLLTYWDEHIDAQSTKYPTTLGDITQRTDFSDKAFDAVLTLSVLEHVSDVGAALGEMARLARTETIHMFGPAWSCAYGHHLYADANDPNLNFVSWQLPAHMHLLCDEEEVCDYYEQLGYDRNAGAMVHDQFHCNGHINRFFYDDYIGLFHRYQIARWETMFNRLPGDHLRRLRSRFPTHRDFSTYGGRYKLLV